MHGGAENLGSKTRVNLEFRLYNRNNVNIKWSKLFYFKSMNLLFIGGNRYFGKEVLNRLLKKNLNIYLVNRNTKKETIKHQNLIHIICDRNNLIKYENIFENIVFDYVFDNIAYNLDDVKYLFKFLRNKIKHYIFTSSS